MKASIRLSLPLVWLLYAAIPSLGFVSPRSSIHNHVAPALGKDPSTSALQSFGDLKGIAEFFKPKQKDDIKPVKPKFDTVLIDPDYRVGALFLALGGLLDTVPYIQLTLGPFITLLGVLFFVQATRIRFIFDEDSIELLNKGQQPGEFTSSGDNIVVGK